MREDKSISGHKRSIVARRFDKKMYPLVGAITGDKIELAERKIES